MELAPSGNACLDLRPFAVRSRRRRLAISGRASQLLPLAGLLAGHLPDGRRASSRPSPAVATQCFGIARKDLARRLRTAERRRRVGACGASGGRGLRLVWRNPLKTLCTGSYDCHMADEFVDDDPEYEGEAEIDEDVDVADRVPADPKEMPDDLGDVGEMERPGYES